MDQLHTAAFDATRSIAAAATLDSLDAIRVAWLGKQGYARIVVVPEPSPFRLMCWVGCAATPHWRRAGESVPRIQACGVSARGSGKGYHGRCPTIKSVPVPLGAP